MHDSYARAHWSKPPSFSDRVFAGLAYAAIGLQVAGFAGLALKLVGVDVDIPAIVDQLPDLVGVVREGWESLQ